MDILGLVGRKELLFSDDVSRLEDQLRGIISGSGFLVIGGAGSIGQAVVTEIFKRDPKNYYRTEIAPYKALLECWFVENRSAWLYFKCIFLTCWVVINSSSNIASGDFKGLPQPQVFPRGW